MITIKLLSPRRYGSYIGKIKNYSANSVDETNKLKNLNNEYFKKINNKIIEYDKYRMSEYPNIPIFKISVGIAGVMVCLTSVYMFFKPQIHKYISSEGSQIAGNIVNSQEIKDSLKAMLSDPDLMRDSTELVKKIAISASNDSELISAGTELIKTFAISICNDPVLKQQIVQLLVQLIGDSATQDVLVDTAINFINRQEIQDQLSALIIAILNRKDVTIKINSLVDETCSHEPNREQLKNMMNAILTSQETKDALYELTSSLVVASIFGKKK